MRARSLAPLVKARGLRDDASNLGVKRALMFCVDILVLS